MDSFTLKDIQLSVQRQVVVIFGGSNVASTLSEALLWGCAITGMGAVMIRPSASRYLP